MRLLPVLIGLILLILGVTAYYTIPNTHDNVSTSMQRFAGQQQQVVGPRGLFRQPFNVTVMPGKNSTLIVNMTVTGSTGSPSQLGVRVSTDNNLDNCEIARPPADCLYQGIVSNQTVKVPIGSSGQYYLILDNTAGSDERVAMYAISVRQDSLVETITRDGMGNWFGLTLGAVGALTTLYGLSRKTVIPWE